MKNENSVSLKYSPDLVTHHDRLSAASEAFHITRTNIEFSAINQDIRTIAITSTNQSEGKTVTAANLAISYAQMGRKVLLVDSDLRRPAVHRYFGYINKKGLTNLLVGIGHCSDYVLPTLTDNLFILPAGPIPPNPTDLLMTQTMSDLINVLTNEFDLILIDCPPVGIVTDAAIIATKVDATVFVVRSGSLNRNELKRAAGMLEQVNARVLGFIINGVSAKSEDYYCNDYTQYSTAKKSSKTFLYSLFNKNNNKKPQHVETNHKTFKMPPKVLNVVNHSGGKKSSMQNKHTDSAFSTPLSEPVRIVGFTGTQSYGKPSQGRQIEYEKMKPVSRMGSKEDEKGSVNWND